MSLPLKKLAAVGAKIGFALSKEAQVDVTLHLAAQRAYDAATDTEVETGGATITVPAIKYRATNQDSNAAPDKRFDVRQATLLIQNADVVAQLAAQALPAMDIEQTDYVMEDGKKWDIQDVMPDPTKAVWTLTVRR